jgi:Fur family zinc uptake transcriptional regulator
MPTPISLTNHNHHRCVDTALKAAQLYCQNHAEKFSGMREAVFRAVWTSHQPIGAYDILDQLSRAETAKRLAPPTVYRALEFLLEHRLIHRINSLNAFVGCSEPGCHPNSQFLICQNCKLAIEIDDKTLQKPLNNLINAHQFSNVTVHLELLGLCSKCQP